MPSVMNALDVFVHASVQPEPYGRVILEAMALGKPVIATDHGGPREIIEDGLSGFLVSPNDPEDLARCLQHLLNSPELRRKIGQHGLKRLVTKFSTTQAVLDFERVYSAVLETTDSVDRINRKAMRSGEAVAAYSRWNELSAPERVLFERVAAEMKGQPILDIGVGGGRTTPPLLSISKDYTGIDYSDGMLAACREKFPGEVPLDGRAGHGGI